MAFQKKCFPKVHQISNIGNRPPIFLYIKITDSQDFVFFWASAPGSFPMSASNSLLNGNSASTPNHLMNTPLNINMEPENGWFMIVWKMISLFKQMIFRFHVNFPGGISFFWIQNPRELRNGKSTMKNEVHFANSRSGVAKNNMSKNVKELLNCQYFIHVGTRMFERLLLESVGSISWLHGVVIHQ